MVKISLTIERGKKKRKHSSLQRLNKKLENLEKVLRKKWKK